MGQELTFSGVIPANVLPFTPEYAIAEAEYRRHLTWLADVPGTTAITVNGHAAEVSSLDRDERRRARRESRGGKGLADLSPQSLCLGGAAATGNALQMERSRAWAVWRLTCRPISLPVSSAVIGRRRDGSTTVSIRWCGCSTPRRFWICNRMKEALVLLGRLDQAVVRPPLQQISSAERRQIAEALSQAGLLEPAVAA